MLDEVHQDIPSLAQQLGGFHRLVVTHGKARQDVTQVLRLVLRKYASDETPPRPSLCPCQVYHVT